MSNVYKPGAPLLLRATETRALYRDAAGGFHLCIDGAAPPAGAGYLCAETETLIFRQSVARDGTVRRSFVSRSLDGDMTFDVAREINLPGFRLTLDNLAGAHVEHV